MEEIWVLMDNRGHIIPPLDEDGTRVVLAWPTLGEAEKGLEHQRQWLEESDTYKPTRVK